jgi:hypothetical protein
MQYVLLIYGAEESWDTLSEDEQKAIYDEYTAFSRDLRDEGKLLGGEELKPTATATTVRLRDGEQLVTDGPFAETREALGGFYLIDAASIEEAIEWAARIPTARTGAVEVRPVMVHGAES